MQSVGKLEANAAYRRWVRSHRTLSQCRLNIW